MKKLMSLFLLFFALASTASASTNKSSESIIPLQRDGGTDCWTVTEVKYTCPNSGKTIVTAYVNTRHDCESGKVIESYTKSTGNTCGKATTLMINPDINSQP
jgi:hypothetical protein